MLSVPVALCPPKMSLHLHPSVVLEEMKATICGQPAIFGKVSMLVLRLIKLIF